MAGRAFGDGLLLNLDLVVGNTIPIPPGQFGAGAELPRRVPFFTILAPFSWLIPGPAVVASVLVASVAAAITGTARLVQPGPSDADQQWDFLGLCLGLVYGLSPMLLTRAAVGHLPLVVVFGLLPWLIRSLQIRPWPTALVWSAVVSLTGSAGSVVALVPLVIFVAFEAQPLLVRLGRLLAVLAAQAVWLVPGLVVVAGGVPLPNTGWEPFATDIETPTDWIRMIPGGGFFVQDQDVAQMSDWTLALAVVLVLPAVLGLTVKLRSNPQRLLRPVVFTALVGAMLVVAPIAPGLRLAWGVALAWSPLSIVREPQKFWPLFGLGLLVAVGAGLRAMPKRWISNAALVAIALVAVVAAWPGLWGAEGRLVVAETPPQWRQIEQALDGEDGLLVVFPWQRYGSRSLSDGRNVAGPAPWLLTGFDGVVSTSGDPGLGEGSVERAEPLADALAEADRQIRAGRPIVADLQSLGVRWVLVDGSPQVDFYRRIIRQNNLREVVNSDNYILVEIQNHQEWYSSRQSLLSVVFVVIGASLTLTLGSLGHWRQGLRWSRL